MAGSGLQASRQKNLSRELGQAREISVAKSITELLAILRRSENPSPPEIQQHIPIQHRFITTTTPASRQETPRRELVKEKESSVATSIAELLAVLRREIPARNSATSVVPMTTPAPIVQLPNHDSTRGAKKGISDTSTLPESIVQSALGKNRFQARDSYRLILTDQFGEILEDPLVEFSQLQETDDIEDYHSKFELIRSKVNLPEDDLVRAFLAGLRIDTQLNVKMFQPQTVCQCLMIGRLYEVAHPKHKTITKLVNTEQIKETAKEEEFIQLDEDLMGVKKESVRKSEDEVAHHIHETVVMEYVSSVDKQIDVAVKMDHDLVENIMGDNQMQQLKDNTSFQADLREREQLALHEFAALTKLSVSEVKANYSLEFAVISGPGTLQEVSTHLRKSCRNQKAYSWFGPEINDPLSLVWHRCRNKIVVGTFKQQNAQVFALIWLPENVFSWSNTPRTLLQTLIPQRHKKKKSYKTYMFKYKHTKSAIAEAVHVLVGFGLLSCLSIVGYIAPSLTPSTILVAYSVSCVGLEIEDLASHVWHRWKNKLLKLLQPVENENIMTTELQPEYFTLNAEILLQNFPAFRP